LLRVLEGQVSKPRGVDVGKNGVWGVKEGEGTKAGVSLGMEKMQKLWGVKKDQP